MNNYFIYIIKNLINGKVYVGQTKRPKNRLWLHKYLLKNESHHNTHLQSAWKKYGEKAFSFELIEECEEENVDEKEIFYIKTYDSYKNGYNKSTGGKRDFCVDPNKIKNNQEDISKAHKQTGLLNSIRRKETVGICLECGIKTKNKYYRYCKKHSSLCKKCNKRIEKGRSTCDECKKTPIKSICSNCKKEIIKNSNRQMYCKECSSKIKKEKAKISKQKHRTKGTQPN